MMKQLAEIAIIRQLFKFGVVGCSAALVNFLVVVALVENWRWHPLVANIVAFVCAYHVSFFGHHFWTFRCQPRVLRFPWLRFLAVACASFALNETLFFVFLHGVGWHYIWSLLAVLVIVPPLTFISSKFWAFR